MAVADINPDSAGEAARAVDGIAVRLDVTDSASVNEALTPAPCLRRGAGQSGIPGPGPGR